MWGWYFVVVFVSISKLPIKRKENKNKKYQFNNRWITITKAQFALKFVWKLKIPKYNENIERIKEYVRKSLRLTTGHGNDYH